jgi:hypothetical protein
VTGAGDNPSICAPHARQKRAPGDTAAWQEGQIDCAGTPDVGSGSVSRETIVAASPPSGASRADENAGVAV